MKFTPIRRFLRYIFAFFIFCVAFQDFSHAATPVDLDDLAARLAPEIEKAGVKSVAVIDFVAADQNPTDLGWYLANKLSDSLITKGAAPTVVDRARLQQVGLATNASLSPNTLKQIGTTTGADAILSGKIEITPEKYLLTITLLKIVDGSVVASTTHSLPHSRVLDLLSPSGANAATIKPTRAGVSGVGVPTCAYSGRARISQTQTVELLVTISAAGTAEKISVIHSPGYFLTERAVETVSEWKFRPAPGTNGTPVPVAVPIDVTFKASRT
jgi:TonB family protein